MTQAIYGGLLMISVIYLLLLLVKFRKHISMYYTLLSVSVVFVNLAYLLSSAAQTLETALAANQVVYLASSLLLLFMIAAIADLCKVNIPGAVIAACVGMSCLLLLCSMTAGKLPWYYREVSLVQRGGSSFLQKEYGPLHVLYPAYIFGILLYGLGIVSSALRKRKTVSHFVSIGSLCLLILDCGVYLGERFFGVDVELMPAAYVASFAVILLMLNRVYKEQFSYDRAFSIIGDSAASHFDPALCQRFLECRPRIEKLYDSYHD